MGSSGERKVGAGGLRLDFEKYIVLDRQQDSI